MIQTAFLLAVLLPYVALPLMRFPADTQPWAALLGWLIVLARIIRKSNLKLSRFDLVLIALALLIMIHIYTDGSLDMNYYLTKNAAFMFSLSILFAGRLITPRALWIAIVLAVALYVFFGTLQLFANSLYQLIGANFVPLRQADLSARGVASLTPEATDFGFLSVYLFLFVVMLMRVSKPPSSTRNLWTVTLATIGCIVASASGAGLIAFVITISIILIPKLRSIRLMILSAIACFAVTPFLLLVQAEGLQALVDSRGVQLLTMLVTSPLTLISETTFSYRFISNVIGTIALVETYGLGYGAGAYTVIAPSIYIAYDLGEVWQLHNYYYSNVLNVLYVEPSGVFPFLVLESGVIGLAFIIHLWRAVYLSNPPYRWAIIILITLTWAQSFPVAWPPFWLLIGLALNPKFQLMHSIKSRIPQNAATNCSNSLVAGQAK